MWTYEQATGKLFKDGDYIVTGYAGHEEGLNNPDMEGIRNVGPIPCGDWNIGPAFTHDKAGQVTMRLTPIGHDAKGRDGFLIHGDNTKGNRSASNGCPIIQRAARNKINDSEDKLLRVVRG